MNRQTDERRYDIDWIRVLATGVIFLFHCARFFNFEDWHVKNNQLDWSLSIFVSVVSQWIMPLFFLLSAFSAYYALGRRTNGQYIQERVQRLLIPLLFGILFLALPQVYIERASHGDFEGSLIDFIPHYFDGFYAFGGNFAWMGLHLWYLEILFIFSLLTVPLFGYLRRNESRPAIMRLSSFLAQPAVLVLLFIPLALLEMLVNLDPEGIGIREFAGWSPVIYLALFIIGYLLVISPESTTTMQKLRVPALVLALIATVAAIGLRDAGFSSYTPLFALLRTGNCWMWLIAILGFGSKHLNVAHPRLSYAGEAMMPFYMLHQTVIVAIGFFIAGWEMGIAAKYLLLGITSFVIIMALYELVIKRVNFLRFCFGMKGQVTAQKPMVVQTNTR